MIHFNQVSKRFAQNELFKNICLFLPKASYTLVCGSPGCGKTTLFKMIMAYETPSDGSLSVNELDISSLPSERIPFLRQQIGLVESMPIMLENRTVAENIAVPLQIAGFEKAAQKERVVSALDELGLGTISDVPVQRLDADQRRLVACARATVHRPPVLLVDTPLQTMRDGTALTQANMLQQRLDDGMTIIVAGHATELPEALAGLPDGGKAFVIDNGKVNPYEYIEYSSGH